jgi:hypothetical protein
MPPRLRVELAGSLTASCDGLSLTVQDDFPVLKMCRRLLEHGADPHTFLECWRGSMLCLIVRSSDEGARLSPAGDGVGFRIRRMVAASPVRKKRHLDPAPPATFGALSGPPTTGEAR